MFFMHVCKPFFVNFMALNGQLNIFHLKKLVFSSLFTFRCFTFRRTARGAQHYIWSSLGQVPPSGTDCKFPSQLSTASSRLRYRLQAPASGTDCKLPSQVLTASSRLRYQLQVPVSGTDCKFQPQVPTASYRLRYWLQVPASVTDCKFLYQVYRLQVPVSGTDCKFPSQVQKCIRYSATCNHIQQALLSRTGLYF